MSWTVLRVVPAGVVLRDAHAARFAHEPPAVRAAFDRFCADAREGIYALRSPGGELVVERRERPWLVPGMPVRRRVSPVASLRGPLAKCSPGPWDRVRVKGVCTLLTDADGARLLEACCAALASWEDGRLVFVPADRPRVASTSESVLRAALPFHERRLEVDGPAPLMAVNAVSGAVDLGLTGRAPMPREPLDLVASVFRAATRR